MFEVVQLGPNSRSNVDSVFVSVLEARLDEAKEATSPRHSKTHDAELAKYIVPFCQGDSAKTVQFIKDCQEACTLMCRERHNAGNRVDNLAKQKLTSSVARVPLLDLFERGARPSKFRDCQNPWDVRFCPKNGGGLGDAECGSKQSLGKSSCSHHHRCFCAKPVSSGVPRMVLRLVVGVAGGAKVSEGAVRGSSMGGGIHHMFKWMWG
jgi:hypothetical protein